MIVEIKNFEKAKRKLEAKEPRFQAGNNEEKIKFEVYYPNEICFDEIFNKGSYDLWVIFTPTGWSYTTSWKGFYCPKDVTHMDCYNDPCDNCFDYADCTEENDYPCRLY